MTNEEFVRHAYDLAEVKDIPGVDVLQSRRRLRRQLCRGDLQRTGEVAKPVEYYGAAFSDMHRELYDIYVSGDVVVVQLALQGTHDGALHLPFGMLPPTGKRMDAPCCDVFKLADGKLQRFDCYPEGTVILSQLGVLGNLDAVLQAHVTV